MVGKLCWIGDIYVYMDVTWNNLTDKGLDFIRR